MKKKYFGFIGFNAIGSTCSIQILDGFETLDKGVQGAANEQATEMFKRVQSKRASSSEELKLSSALRTETVPENIKMNLDEIYLVPFRLISATIVGGGTWKATDFSKAGVLKKSMPLLKNKPVYRDHMMYVDCWAGIVNDVSWTNGYKQGDIDVPAGIDGLLALDTSSEDNRDLAKGVNMGAVSSNSVTVEFEWEPSHEFEKEWTFYENIGSMVDGRMVCRVVTRVIEYHETSLVGLGADPFAKKLVAGELENIDKAGAEEANSNNNFPFQAVEANSISEKMAASRFTVSMSKKESFGTAFGEKLKGAIDGMLSATTEGETTSDDVLQQMADAAGISVQSVKLYISGKNKCPKLEYIKAWAKLLRCTAKSLIAAAEGDGCEYEVKSQDIIAESTISNEKVQALENRLGSIESSLAAIGAAIEKISSLGTNAVDLKASSEEGEDMEEEMEDCEEEMSKEPTMEQAPPTTEQTTEQEVISSNKAGGMNFEAQYNEIVLVLKANKLEYDTLLVAKEKEMQQLQNELKDMQHLTDIGRASLEASKKEAIRLYIASASKKGKASDEFVALIASAKSVEILNEIIKQQGRQLAEQFAFTCGKCGSDECNFGSVLITQEVESYNKAETLTHDQIVAKYS